ncbi:MAG TPA: PQQ-binding-like beta-propeller repeat protein [Blastocatellia bacterium]|nr:PQQ-binding-like beta-propeller repeat protein [Blastocatellia bacterium]
MVGSKASLPSREANSDLRPMSGFVRHRGPITCAAGLPGGRIVLTSGYDGAVAFFDLDKETVELLGYHKHLVNRITINQEGTRAASSSSDYSIRIWNIETRELERILLGHTDDVEDFAFVDARTGVSASRDHRVIVWDLETGAIARILEGHEKDVLSVAYSAGRIYSSGDDMTLRQWDLSTGAMLRVWGPFEQETDTCAIDALKHRAILGADDGRIRLFDVETGNLLREFSAHSSGIKKVAVSPLTGDILSAAYDRRIIIWDADSFALKAELENFPSMWERSLNWSSDGGSVFAGTFDGTVIQWDAKTGKRLIELGAPGEGGGNACFNDVSAGLDGEIALVSDDGYIRAARLTAEGAEWTGKIEPARGRILMNAVMVDAIHGVVMGGAHNHKLFMYQRADGEFRDEREVSLNEGPINCIRMANNPGYEGDVFAACYSSAIVRVGLDGKIRGKIQVHEGAVKSLRIHPNIPAGVSCGADGLLLSWKLDGGLLERFPGHTAIVDDVDIDPTGQFAASVSRDFKLNVYRFTDGRLLHSIPLGQRSPKSVCFWSSSVVIVGDYWGALIRVDPEGQTLLRKTIARNGISSLARSGEHLVAASYDGAVYLVSPEDLTVVRTLRAMTQRLQARVAFIES